MRTTLVALACLLSACAPPGVEHFRDGRIFLRPDTGTGNVEADLSTAGDGCPPAAGLAFALGVVAPTGLEPFTTGKGIWFSDPADLRCGYRMSFVDVGAPPWTFTVSDGAGEVSARFTDAEVESCAGVAIVDFESAVDATSVEVECADG